MKNKMGKTVIEKLKKIISKDYKVLLFDFDGTLLNSEPKHFLAYKKTIEEIFPKEKFTFEQFKKFIGHNDEEIYGYISQFSNIDVKEKIDIKKRYSLELLKEDDVKIFDYFDEIVKNFKNLEFVIVSNQDEHIITEVLKIKGIYDCFSKIVSMPQVRINKLDYLRDLKQNTGYEISQAMLFEDSARVVNYCHDLGYKTIAVINNYNKNDDFKADLTIDCTDGEK